MLRPSASIISLVCMNSCDTAHVRCVAATVKGWSRGAIVWLSPTVNLNISSHLSETEAVIRPASGPLTRAYPSISQNNSAVWFHQMQQALRMGSVCPGRQICKGISGLPWHDIGRLSRNSCVSPCFIISSSPPLNPLVQSLHAAGSSKLSEQHGSSWGNLTLPEIPSVVLSPRRNAALMKCLEADVPDCASLMPSQTRGGGGSVCGS